MPRYVKRECECGLDIGVGQFKRHLKGNSHLRRMNRITHHSTKHVSRHITPDVELPADLAHIISTTQQMALMYNELPGWARSLFWETAKRNNGSEHKE